MSTETIIKDPVVTKSNGTGHIRSGGLADSSPASVMDRGQSLQVPPGGYYECLGPEQDYPVSFGSTRSTEAWLQFGTSGSADGVTDLVNVSTVAMELDGISVNAAGGWSFTRGQWLKIRITRAAAGDSSLVLKTSPNNATFGISSGELAWMEWINLERMVVDGNIFAGCPRSLRINTPGQGYGYNSAAIGATLLTGDWEVVLRTRLPREMFFGITRQEDIALLPGGGRYIRMSHCLNMVQAGLTTFYFELGVQKHVLSNPFTNPYYGTSQGTRWRIRCQGGMITLAYNAGNAGTWTQFYTPTPLNPSATGHRVDIGLVFGPDTDAIMGVEWRPL